MTRIIFNTATTLDGYLADEADSLSWLFSVPGAEGAENDFGTFLRGVGTLVMGSTTYEWVVDHEGLIDHPERWPYPGQPAFVLSTRTLPAVEGADIRFRSGRVDDLRAEILAAAGDRDVWLVGGGDLVGQFADARLLDEVRVSIAPATLGSGKPLLPRRLGADRLHLDSVRQNGQFAELAYTVDTSE